MASISKIYIDGVEHTIKSTLDEDKYKVIMFNTVKDYEEALANNTLKEGNSCFVISNGELFLYRIKGVSEDPEIIQITSLVNTQMKQLRETFADIKTTAEGFSESLKTLAAGVVKIFPSLEIALHNYTPTENEVTEEEESAPKGGLAAGTYILTLGRYELNDGGSGVYYVSPENASADNIFVYDLENSENKLVLIHDDYLNFTQLGGKANDATAAEENTRILSTITGKGKVSLKFNEGIFYFNSVILNGGNISIEGVHNNTDLISDANGTVICYAKANANVKDTYLWAIGDTPFSSANAFYSNISLKNLTFSGGIVQDEDSSVPRFSNNAAQNLKMLLSLNRVKNGNFENLSFKGFHGEGLRLASCVDSNFSNLSFQYGYCLNKREETSTRKEGALVFGAETLLNSSTINTSLQSYTENLVFNSLFFKGIIGTGILFDEGCNVSSTSFRNIIYDGGNVALNTSGTTTPWSNVNYRLASDVNEDYIQLGAITLSCGSKTSCVDIQNFKGQYFSYYYYSVISGDSEIKYMLDRIVDFEDPKNASSNAEWPTQAKVGLSFGTITHQKQQKDILLGRLLAPNDTNIGHYVGKDFHFSVERIITDDSRPMLFDTDGSGPVDFCPLGEKSLYNPKTNYNNCIDYMITHTTPRSPIQNSGMREQIIHGAVCYDERAAAKNKLVLRLTPVSYRVAEGNSDFDPCLISALFPIEGEEFNIRAYLNQNHQLAFWLINLQTLQPTREAVISFTENSGWKWLSYNLKDLLKNPSNYNVKNYIGTHALAIICPHVGTTGGENPQPNSPVDSEKDLLDIFY